MRGKHVLWMGIGLLIVSSSVLTAWPSSRPKITYMRTCIRVIKGAAQFDASGWTASFNSGDTIYCVVKVDVPYDASNFSYDATMSWYTPNGDLYYEHDYDDLERGYIWSLWGSVYNASLAGEWRVVFSVTHGPKKSLVFTVGSTVPQDDLSISPPDIGLPPPALDLPDIGSQPTFPPDFLDYLQPTPPAIEPPSVEPVIGREQEPNEGSETANLLKLDERVQGEVRFYSDEVYDQDWFRIRLANDREYWLEINAVGTTSSWLSPINFLKLYDGDRLDQPLSFSSQSNQEKREDHSTCDALVPIQGPGTFYILIQSQDCEHDIYYSLQIATSKPKAGEGES